MFEVIMGATSAFSTQLTLQPEFYTSLSILLHNGKGIFHLTVHEALQLFVVIHKSDLKKSQVLLENLRVLFMHSKF